MSSGLGGMRGALKIMVVRFASIKLTNGVPLSIPGYKRSTEVATALFSGIQMCFFHVAMPIGDAYAV